MCIECFLCGRHLLSAEDTNLTETQLCLQEAHSQVGGRRKQGWYRLARVVMGVLLVQYRPGSEEGHFPWEGKVHRNMRV